ncbi:MAG: GntR family transcriptional regulator [Bacteroidota bacterium]
MRQWSNPVPLYMQAKELIMERIRAGVYRVGERLPSEAELARELGISPSTLRQTINALAAEGVVVRRPSQGTFVVGLWAEPGAVPLRSFTEAMRERGVSVETRVVEAAVRPAGAQVAWQLDMGAGQQVVYLKRLRLAREQPLAIEETFIPIDLAPELAEPGRALVLTEHSLYQLLEQRYGLTPISAEETIWAEGARPEWAEMLGLAAEEPVLIAERVTEVSGHQRGFFSRLIMRGDAYLLKLRMTRYPQGRGKAGWEGQ